MSTSVDGRSASVVAEADSRVRYAEQMASVVAAGIPEYFNHACNYCPPCRARIALRNLVALTTTDGNRPSPGSDSQESA